MRNGISNLKVYQLKCLFLKGIIVLSDEKKEKENLNYGDQPFMHSISTYMANPLHSFNWTIYQSTCLCCWALIASTFHFITNKSEPCKE